MESNELQTVLHKTFVEVYKDLEQLVDIAKKG
ncbi:regulatory protein, partial [Bacillus amyloliquefaciens]